jgi:hypothetical protein
MRGNLDAETVTFHSRYGARRVPAASTKGNIVPTQKPRIIVPPLTRQRAKTMGPLCRYPLMQSVNFEESRDDTTEKKGQRRFAAVRPPKHLCRAALREDGDESGCATRLLETGSPRMWPIAQTPNESHSTGRATPPPGALSELSTATCPSTITGVADWTHKA